MRIFGIDPGTLVLGYALVEDGGRAPRLIDGGAIRAPRSAPLPERLHRIATRLAELLSAARADVVAIERPFHGRNVAALIALGEGRGVALACAAGLGLPVHEYTPAEVKKAVTGRGGARKEQVAVLVGALLGGEAVRGGLDASDAAAVALCHAHRRHLLEGAGNQGSRSLAKGRGAARARRGRGR